MTRRQLLQSLSALSLAPALRSARPTDIRLVEVRHGFDEFRYRMPYQFGGRTVDRVTILNVDCRVRTGDGKESWGFGSMTLGNAWAFPAVSHEDGLGAMKALADELRGVTARCDETGHPIDLFRALEPEFLRSASAVSRARGLSTPIPKLCTLVVASAFDAAIHDAYGKAFGLSAYETYGQRFMTRDLSHDLGPQFKGEFLDRYVPSAPRATTPVFHSVGASDPLESGDVRTRIDDGLPNTLEEWIPRDGLIRFKIKLNGGNLDADITRIVRIDRIVTRVQAERKVADWKYLLDFNEGCPNVGYLLECLRKVRETTPSGFDRILYIEQPTARDLQKDRANIMHEAAKLRPVVIDESLTDLEALLLAREMGYTGVALKACKGQSQAMLMAAAAQKFGMFLCVQDLTCPGASLIHSAGIAARVPGNAGIEANARQFVPSASAAWEPRFPGLFTIKNGVMNTGQLTGPGLSAVPPGPRGTILAAGVASRVATSASERVAGSIFCLFSKHLPELGWAELAQAVKDAGYEGVDLTVRPQGHVLPERAADDLPRAIEAITSRGVKVPMITTELTTARSPFAKPILQAAARGGVKYFKTGYWRYSSSGDVRAELSATADDLKSLAALAQEVGIEMGFHNHAAYIGAALWDIAPAMDRLDPRWAGYYFDPRHAVAEGGAGAWKSATRLVVPRLKMLALKDCYWSKTPKGWTVENCPLGEGMVDWSWVSQTIRSSGFSGPISVHLEYEIPTGTNHTLDAARRDLAIAKKFLAV